MSHNLTLLANLGRYQRLGRPVVLGVSRKGVIGTIIARERSERLAGSLAVGCFAVAEGAAQILRVHDVAAHRDAALLWEALAPYRLTSRSELPR
jgi:dihydropteroate synthase